MAVELQAMADELHKDSDATRAGQKRTHPDSRSKRQIGDDEKNAEELEEKGGTCNKRMKEIEAAVDSLKEAKEELDEIVRKMEARIEEGGSALKIYKSTLAEFGVFEQRWWGGQLNGPDLRKLMALIRKILAKLKARLLELKFPEEKIDAFVELHAAPMELLSRIGELSRACRMLAEPEIEELCKGCVEYGAMVRKNFPDESITPKLHYLESHVPRDVRRFGTVGLFACEGGESVHPRWKQAAISCRCVQNPEARLRATQRLF